MKYSFNVSSRLTATTSSFFKTIPSSIGRIHCHSTSPVTTADHPRTAKRAKYSGNIVTIKAGSIRKDQKTFNIHEDVIKGTSSFFRATLDKKWKEGQAREIKLPEDSPQVVFCYIDWCYSKEVPSSKPGPPTDLYRAEMAEEYELLTKLYIFGEKAQDDAFCDAVMAAFTQVMDLYVRGSEKERFHCFPGASQVAAIYCGTPTESPARRCMVDVYLSCSRGSWFEKEPNGFLAVPQFLQDLVVAQLEASGPRGQGGDTFGQRKRWFKLEAAS